jgi:hypothetical protein
MADIVIINPRFDISFWGLEHCTPLFGKRANFPVACLGLLAALANAICSKSLAQDAVKPVLFLNLSPENFFIYLFVFWANTVLETV